MWQSTTSAIDRNRGAIDRKGALPSSQIKARSRANVHTIASTSTPQCWNRLQVRSIATEVRSIALSQTDFPKTKKKKKKKLRKLAKH
jgi:hypothetical protein